MLLGCDKLIIGSSVNFNIRVKGVFIFRKFNSPFSSPLRWALSHTYEASRKFVKAAKVEFLIGILEPLKKDLLAETPAKCMANSEHVQVFYITRS